MVECFVLMLPLRECASRCHVCLKTAYTMHHRLAAAKTPRPVGIDLVRESGQVEAGLRKSRRLPSVLPAPSGLLPRNAGSGSNLELAYLQVHPSSSMAPSLHQMGIIHFPRGRAIPCGWLGRSGFRR